MSSQIKQDTAFSIITKWPLYCTSPALRLTPIVRFWEWGILSEKVMTFFCCLSWARKILDYFKCFQVNVILPYSAIAWYPGTPQAESRKPGYEANSAITHNFHGDVELGGKDKQSRCSWEGTVEEPECCNVRSRGVLYCSRRKGVDQRVGHQRKDDPGGGGEGVYMCGLHTSTLNCSRSIIA